MNRVDEFCEDLQMLINEHKRFEIAIEKIAKYESAIENIKAEITDYMTSEDFGMSYIQPIYVIIDKHIGG